mgnify:CR=1 FL=1
MPGQTLTDLCLSVGCPHHTSETQKIFETKWLAGLLLLGVNLAGALFISWLYGKGKALRHILPFLLISVSYKAADSSL